MATSTENLTALDGSRIHPSWANSGEIALAIMRGEHDAELSSIDNAVAARNKARFRKGARFVLKGTRNAEIEGKECTVIKVNAKRITVGIGTLTRDQWGDEWSEGEILAPPNMLHPIDVASTS